MHISDIFQKIDLKLFGMGSGQTRIAKNRPGLLVIDQDSLGLVKIDFEEEISNISMEDIQICRLRFQILDYQSVQMIEIYQIKYMFNEFKYKFFQMRIFIKFIIHIIVHNLRWIFEFEFQVCFLFSSFLVVLSFLKYSCQSFNID